MRINRIELENFRTYAKNVIEFDRSTNLAIFNFLNGTGKTSLLNAISWCLHGEEIYPRERGLAGGNALRDAVHSTSEILTKVSLEVSFDDGADATIVRTANFLPVDRSGNSAQKTNESIRVTAKPAGEQSFATVEDPEYWIFSRLPQSLSGHYLFDGQNLSKFFDPNTSGGIRESVLQIARVDALARTIEHLEKVIDSLTVPSKTRSRADSGTTATDVESLENRIVDIEAEIATLKESIRDVETEYGGSPVQAAEKSEEARETIASRKDLERIRTDAAEAEKNASESLYQLIRDDAAAGVLLQTVESVNAKLNQSKSPSVSPDIISSILSEGRCLCGCDLEADAASRKHLEELLYGLNQQGSEVSVLAPLKQVFVDLANTGQDFKPALEAAWAAKDRATKTKVRAVKDLRVFDDKLKMPLDEIKSQQKNAVQLASVATNYTAAKAKVDNLQNELQQKRSELRTARDKALSRETTSIAEKENQNLARFANECLKSAEEVFNQSISAVRADLSRQIDSFYRDVVPTEVRNTIDSIEIDERFIAKVTSKNGVALDEGDSAGYNLLLALSFSFALSSLTGFEMPIIIDTPYASLDMPNKIRLTERICKAAQPGGIADGRQIIFLMTDSELSAEVRTAFVKSGAPEMWTGKRDLESETIEVKRVSNV